MEIACAAVLFDADGTLVDSTAAVERTWRAWADVYGVDAEAVLRVCHGRRSEETIAEFLPAEAIDSAVRRLDELELVDLGDVVPCPGAVELLNALGAAGSMAWAVVTSGIVPLVTARLHAAGLAVPDVLVTAEDVASGKPDPDGYLLAARKIGVPAEQCVVIEDAPAGIRSARAAGAAVIGVTTTHRATELEEADSVVASLHQIDVRTGSLVVQPATPPSDTE